MGWEGPFKAVYSNPTPDQVASSPMEPDFEHRQGWGTHSFHGQPLPVYV